MDDVIKVENLSKVYGEIAAVEDLSFSVKRGEVLGLLGANGAGKSTTIECILGTKFGDRGKVSILGMNPLERRKELFEKVGVQFQESHYQENIRVGELCSVVESLYEEPCDYKKLLASFGIGEKSKSPVKELSGGERQRLFIVLAMISNPEVLFLDELSTGLDVKGRRDIIRYIHGLKKSGITVLLSSHYMDEVEKLCDRVCILKSGRTQFYGTVDDAIEQSPHDNLEEAYLWYADEGGDRNERI